MGFFGMDVLAIRHLSRQLDTQAGEADKATLALTGAIRNAEWFGADNARFVEEWNSVHAPAMRRASALLKEAAQIAQQSAVAQERASGAS